MIVLPVTASALLVAATVLLLDLNPERIKTDMLKILSPRGSLKARVKIAQGKSKALKISLALEQINDALAATGKGGQFATICTMSVSLLVAGIVLAIAMDNLFLIPVMAVALAVLPFVYAKTVIGYYEKHVEEEMETALSIVSTSYIRSDDLIKAVQENIEYLKPPVRGIFRSFLGDATAVSSDISHSLQKLKTKIDNRIFKEWCDTLIRCQNDRKIKDTLLPVVNKLSDVRMVNSELKTMLYEPRKEYFMMAAMVAGNVPLLYLLNKSWYYTLVYTMPGKLALAITGAVLLVTALLMLKYTKPIEYRR